MGKKRIFTRREFLRASAVTPLAGMFMSGAYGLKFPLGQKSSSQKTRVVLVRDKDPMHSFGKPDSEVIQRMLDQAVSALMNEKDSVVAWKKIVKPSDVVGIKTNIWSYIPTTKEVELALKRRIMDAGVPEANIGTDDRGVRQNSIFQNATALINARPARTHHWAGMGSCIKNYIMFVPRPEDYHGDSCADLATIWKDYGLDEKTRLNVLVMLNPLFHGIGPHHFSRKYCWEYRGILVSRDPVAVDSIGVRILQAKRREFFGEDRPLQPPAKHIFLADTRHHLGTSDPAQIELIKLGWQEGVLI